MHHLISANTGQARNERFLVAQFIPSPPYARDHEKPGLSLLRLPYPRGRTLGVGYGRGAYFADPLSPGVGWGFLEWHYLGTGRGRANTPRG